MARKETNDNSVDVKVAPFKVQWPPELDIKPLFTVEVSNTRSVQVFRLDADHFNNGVVTSKQAVYRPVPVITKTGRLVVNDGYHAHHRNVFTELLDVRMWIEEYSRSVQAKTKTVTSKVKVEINDDEGDEE